MPKRNRVKEYVSESYYHLYNRGNNKQPVFNDDQDYSVFMNLLKRHLGKKQSEDKLGRLYPNYHDQLELLAFCLMPNHFHLLVYQHDPHAITRLMRSIGTSYTGYINNKYDQVGHIFQGSFLASRITSDNYWLHISRYIHLNPKDWKNWQWSSLPYYISDKKADWVRPKRILDGFEDSKDYYKFVSDYGSQKEIMDELKHELAAS